MSRTEPNLDPQSDRTLRRESIEQSQEPTAPPHKAPRADLVEVDSLAHRLISELREVPDGDVVGEIIVTAMRLLRDRTNRGDIKLINKSMKELRYALKVFAPYREIRKVSIFGSARTPETHEDYVQAVNFAKKMAEAGWMVITGAGGGIMAAGHGGAGAEPSFGLAIRLPFEQETNIHIAHDPKLINFKYFFTRKLMFVRSSHAITLFPGGFGTMDEGFEVLTLIQTGKSVPMPVVYIDRPGGDYWRGWQEYVEKQLLHRGLISEHDLHLYKVTDSIDEAAEEILHFYRNFHSIRYAREELVFRLHYRPTEEQLEYMNQHFADLKTGGRFRMSDPLPVERDEHSIRHLHRLLFRFNRRDHGRLRLLIDYLNDLPQCQ